MNGTKVTPRNHKTASERNGKLVDLTGRVRTGIDALELLQKAAVGGAAELMHAHGRIRALGDTLVDASLRLQGSCRLRQRARGPAHSHKGTVFFAGEPAVAAFLDVFGVRPICIRLLAFPSRPPAWPPDTMGHSLIQVLMEAAVALDHAHPPSAKNDDPGRQFEAVDTGADATGEVDEFGVSLPGGLVVPG